MEKEHGTGGEEDGLGLLAVTGRSWAGVREEVRSGL